MRQVKYLFLLCLALFSFLNCQQPNLSRFGPIPSPKNNGYNREVAELGEKLFFDKRLSLDNSVSCANCHQPELAFTDGKEVSTGHHGKLSMRNTPSLFNVAFQKTLMADGQVPSLEMQALVPLLDTSEMANEMKTLILKLRNIKEYQKASKKLFKRDFDPFVLTQSLANYQRTLISDDSAFDRYYFEKNEKAISKEAKKGWLVFSEELYCTKCHTPPLFTSLKVENNGLYKNYSEKVDKGRFRIHGDSSEIGSFKVPSLRNISITAPYMHDGRFKSLDEVLTFYAKGGNGHFNQSSIIQPFQLTSSKRKELKAFLTSLEDNTIEKNER